MIGLILNFRAHTASIFRVETDYLDGDQRVLLQSVDKHYQIIRCHVPEDNTNNLQIVVRN
jgi:nitrate reductase cytochrome c-type subunit